MGCSCLLIASKRRRPPGLSSSRAWSPALMLSVLVANCATYSSGVSMPSHNQAVLDTPSVHARSVRANRILLTVFLA